MPSNLSRREREIMDIVYRRAAASAQEVLRDLGNPPSYSAVRALLRVLVGKGHLQFRQDGPRYVYSPRVARRAAGLRALRDMVNTFFDGSAARAASALLDEPAVKLSKAELDELQTLIDAARGKAR